MPQRVLDHEADRCRAIEEGRRLGTLIVMIECYQTYSTHLIIGAYSKACLDSGLGGLGLV